MKRILTLVLTMALVATAAYCDDKEQAKAAFEMFKKLEGTWKGKGKVGDMEMDSTVTYKTTGAGSVVMETMEPGQPHEMVTMYHLNNESFELVHYCAGHNQPRMRMKPGKDPKVVSFEFVSGTNMKPSDMHMHTATYRFIDDDHITGEWTSYQDGKPGASITFDMHRAK
ncbi:MAG: hypothetical protein JST30_05865 [Armatimonadetes bacterium]|nr:hypothetical protein [Armatimonadota bacterium]